MNPPTERQACFKADAELQQYILDASFSGSSLCFMIPFYEYLNASTVSLQNQKSIDLSRWSLLTQLYSVGWLSLVQIMDVTSHCLYQCRFIVSCDWSGFLCIKTLFLDIIVSIYHPAQAPNQRANINPYAYGPGFLISTWTASVIYGDTDENVQNHPHRPTSAAISKVIRCIIIWPWFWNWITMWIYWD